MKVGDDGCAEPVRLVEAAVDHGRAADPLNAARFSARNADAQAFLSKRIWVDGSARQKARGEQA
jgi:hypothetical protein